MKKISLLLIALIYMSVMVSASPGMNDKFDAFKEKFVVDMWKVYPGWASSVGYHNYDSVLIVPNAASRTKEVAFCQAQLAAIKKFPLVELNDANKTDYHLIDNQLHYAIWSINKLKAYEWDPTTYNICGSFADMLGNNYAPVNERLRNFYKRMASVNAYYEAAKKNIKNPTLEHTRLAIDQNKGGTSVFDKDLAAALKSSTLSPAEQQQITDRAKQTVAIINNFAAWLEKMPNSTPRSFRMGAALYDEKFALEMQSGYTTAQIFDKAIQHKEDLHSKMLDITRQLWPKYFPGVQMPENRLTAIKQMIDVLSLNHVKADSFQVAIEHQLPVLVDFIKRKDLIYIDPTKPLVVRREPDYMAGVAGASVNSPGPYDKNGNTYYNVGSLDGWDKEKAESYLREYNHYILQILNIHEAIPGHYTQLVYANQSPSIVKAILGNNAMIEGWAVYTERMMLENGYDGDLIGTNATAASPEMWLMYYKWNLRSTCNTILDIGVHTRNLTYENAMHLLTTEAFQQKAEAEGKWKRVSVTQVQLCCYFTGYTEIYDLRSEIKQSKGKDFDLKKFHEQFLSYGSAPVKYIRELMLKK